MVSSRKKSRMAEAGRAKDLCYSLCLISLADINVLTQHRRTFLADSIEALAENIAHYGLLEAIIVAALDPKEAEEYVELANRHFKSAHSLSELTRAPGGKYWILLSGEMRLRAHKHLWTFGCSVCRENFFCGKTGVKNYSEPPGTCYGRHFGEEKAAYMIEAKIYEGLSAVEAIDIQLSGNCYTPPPENELVASIAFLYQVKKRLDPKLTISRFARTIGKSPGTISGYLAVYSLPDEIYELYHKGFISYGIACELASLKKQDPGESLTWWANRAMLSKINVGEFRKRIKKHLASKNQGILEIFESAAAEQQQRRHIRETVEQEMIGDLHQGVAYWKKVLRLFQEGKLGKEDSPFSEGGPCSLYRKQVELMRMQVLPHLAGFLPKSALREIERVMAQVDTQLSLLEKKREPGSRAEKKKMG